MPGYRNVGWYDYYDNRSFRKVPRGTCRHDSSPRAQNRSAGEDMGPLSEPEKEQKRLQIRIWRYILGGALGTVSLYYFYKWFLKRRNPLLEAFIEQELRLKGPRSQDISYEQRMQNRQAMEEAYPGYSEGVVGENMTIMAVAVAMVDHATEEEVWVHMEVSCLLRTQ